MLIFFIIFAYSNYFFMKHKGSVTEIYKERDEIVLPALYRIAAAKAVYPTTVRELCTIVAKLPTDCHYISDDAAFAFIKSRKYHRGERHFHSPYKHRLYESLWQSFCEIDKEYPEERLQTKILRALRMPAPCVGLTPNIIQIKLNKRK